MNELELRDIHLPDASLWWPPAPGWWLTLLLLLTLALMLPWLLRRLRHRPLSRLTLDEFERIRGEFANGAPERRAVNDIARLLRRTVISYRGRAAHAATTGAGWIAELEQLAPLESFSAQQLQLLARDRYRADCDCDVDSLLRASECWIRSLPRSEAHVAD